MPRFCRIGDKGRAASYEKKRSIICSYSMNIKNRSGQILVIVPFLVVFLFGLTLLVIDISVMAEKRIEIQTAADVAARDGALTQACFIDQIANINSALVYPYYVMSIQCLCRWRPLRNTKICIPWRAANKTAKGLITAQDNLKRTAPAAIEIAVVESGKTNGASFARAALPSLKLRRTFAISGGYDVLMNRICYDVVRGGRPAGFMLREDIRFPGGTRGSCHIRERVDVTAVKKEGPAYGSAILGNHLKFPKIEARSSARPYWLGNVVVGKHNPRKDDLRGGAPFANENYTCMFQGRWDAKLVTYGKR